VNLSLHIEAVLSKGFSFYFFNFVVLKVSKKKKQISKFYQIFSNLKFQKIPKNSETIVNHSAKIWQK